MAQFSFDLLLSILKQDPKRWVDEGILTSHFYITMGEHLEGLKVSTESYDAANGMHVAFDFDDQGLIVGIEFY